MKKLIFGILIMLLFAGCTKTTEIADLKKFCDYTVECYKNDRKSDAVHLKMTRKEVVAMLNSMKLPAELKKKKLSAVERQDEEGYFSNKRLEKLYVDFRSAEKNEFWKNCTIAGYEQMETDSWFGYEMAEPIVQLKHGDYVVSFKIGELIKTKEGWRIIEGPFWK